MKEHTFRYLYGFLVGVLACSLLLVALMEGFAPFGLRVSWSEQGIGDTLVLTKPLTGVAVSGDRIAVRAANNGSTDQTRVFAVQGVTRYGGTLRYLQNSESSAPPYIDAWRVTGRVVTTIPIAGAWVRALNHPVGAAALLGIPIVMLVIDLLIAMLGSLTLSLGRVHELVQTTPSAVDEHIDESDLDDTAMERIEQHAIARETPGPRDTRRVPSVDRPAVGMDGVVLSAQEGANSMHPHRSVGSAPTAHVTRSIEGILAPDRRYGV